MSSSSHTNTQGRRGSGGSFLGTIAKLQDSRSSHVSIVDETGILQAPDSPPAATWTRTRATPRRGTSGTGERTGKQRAKSPVRCRSRRRSKSPKKADAAPVAAPMVDQSGDSVGGSTRRMANSTSTFISRTDDSESEEARDFDDLDDFNVLKATSSAPPAQRTSSASSTPRRSFWKNKSRDGVVDQRVNLMDAETGQYERQASARRNNMGFRQKSLVDIFLTDDFGNSDHTRTMGDSLSSLDKERKSCLTNWLRLFFLVCLIGMGAWLTFGIGSKGDDASNGDSITAPPDTNPPTPAPTEEIKQEEQTVVDTEEGSGLSLTEWLTPKDRPGMATTTSPNPEAGGDLNVALNRGGGDGLEEEPETQEEKEQPEEPIVEVTSPNPASGSLNVALNRGGSDLDLSLDTTAIPTDSRQEALQFLVMDQDISEADELQDPDSAASTALRWISDEDPAQLPIPGVDEVDDAVEAERQLVQRYAMAVFYFSQQMYPSAGDEQGSRKLKEITHEQVINRRKFDKQWTSKKSVCQWPGVTCDSKQLVTAIDVSESLLGGTLPREIMRGSAFPAMTTLDVSHNQLQGSLPRLYESNAATGRLMLPSDNALEFLFLQHNVIQGNIDPIVTLERLTYVDLSSNEFTGNIPTEFGIKLKQLDTFHLAMNNLQGMLPANLSELTELARLDLKGNSFTGTIPSEWSSLTGLEELTLSHCKTIEGTIPSALGSMLSMKYLSLQETSLKGAIPSFLGDLTQLKELYLHNTELEGAMPETICSLKDEADLKEITSDCADELGTVTCTCCTDCFWR